MLAWPKCFLWIILLLGISCTNFLSSVGREEVLAEMKTALDACKVVPKSSPMYAQFKVNTNSDTILEYSYHFPNKKYASNCYIEAFWLDLKDTYLEADYVDGQKSYFAFLRAPDKPKLDYQFACYALLPESTAHSLVLGSKKEMVITKNTDGSYDCHTKDI
jgi:hypothetical protein